MSWLRLISFVNLLSFVVCPLLPEIAVLLLSEDEVNDYCSLIERYNAVELKEKAKKYMNTLFEYDVKHNLKKMHKMFIYNNAQWYLCHRENNSPYLNEIGLELHGLTFPTIRHFVYITLREVKKLRQQHLNTPECKKYSEVILNIGRGLHSKSTLNESENHKLLLTSLRRNNYTVEVVENNPGLLRVVLDETLPENLTEIEKHTDFPLNSAAPTPQRRPNTASLPLGRSSHRPCQLPVDSLEPVQQGKFVELGKAFTKQQPLYSSVLIKPPARTKTLPENTFLEMNIRRRY